VSDLYYRFKVRLSNTAIVLPLSWWCLRPEVQFDVASAVLNGAVSRMAAPSVQLICLLSCRHPFFTLVLLNPFCACRTRTSGSTCPISTISPCSPVLLACLLGHSLHLLLLRGNLLLIVNFPLRPALAPVLARCGSIPLHHLDAVMPRCATGQLLILLFVTNY
jgi:hypothetical protein